MNINQIQQFDFQQFDFSKIRKKEKKKKQRDKNAHFPKKKKVVKETRMNRNEFFDDLDDLTYNNDISKKRFRKKYPMIQNSTRTEEIKFCGN